MYLVELKILLKKVGVKIRGNAPMKHGPVNVHRLDLQIVSLLDGCPCLTGHRIAFVEDLAVAVLGSSFSFTTENTRLVGISEWKKGEFASVSRWLSMH